MENNKNITVVQDFTSLKYKILTCDLKDTIQKISSKHKFFTLITQARKIKEVEGKSKRYKDTRRSIPGICWSATFPTQKRTIEQAIPTGLLYIDIDIDITREEILANPIGKYIIALWRSIGGDGFGGIIEYSPTDTPFKEVYTQLNKISGNILDKQCCDITRVNFLSYDDNMYLNYSADVYLAKKSSSLSNGVQNNSIINDVFCNVTTTHAFNNKDYREKSSSLSIPSPSPSNYSGMSSFSHQFKNTNAGDYVVEGEEYSVFPQGVEVEKCYLPRRIKRGERRSVLLSYFTTFFRINPHKFSYRHIYATIKQISNKMEGGMLEEKKIKGIYLTLKKQIETNGLTLNEKSLITRKIIFSDNCTYSKNKKRKTVNKVIGKLKSQKTEDKIQIFFEDEVANMTKINYKTIADAIGISVATLKRRMTEEQKETIKHLKTK